MNLKHILSYSLFILYCIVGILQSSARNADRQEIVNYTNRYTFSCITMQDGLPHVFVDDVVKDSRGYLWLSTMGGGVVAWSGVAIESISY